MNEQPFSFESGGLRLEGALHQGAGNLCAVVLHPHPQFGGDMDNHVVMAICEAMAERGATTLRFNSRGTGASEGAYDAGRGEVEDAKVAVKMLREKHPDAKFLLAGYSFGAIIAGNAAGDVRPDALVLVAPPAAIAPMPHVDDDWPVLLITGERDAVAPPDVLRALQGPNRRVVIVPGVDHSWRPGIDELSVELTSFMERGFPG